MQEQDKTPESGISRRDFIQTVAASGAGLMLSKVAFSQATTSTQAMSANKPASATAAAAPAIHKPGAKDVINVAIIGMGLEGRVLIEAATRIPNIRFKACCDIWAYDLQYGSRTLKAKGHQVNAYEDYREMLAKEKDLDAVIVATPDWMHAEHAIACMEAGHHVYCEKEMSNSLEKAREMVLAQRRTGKLLQIGHQRRSNPRYQFALDKIIYGNKILGQVTQANGQWNRAKSEDFTWPKKYEMTAEQLNKYGYNTMHEFRNWRWFKKYGGGPIVDLGSHQIDIFTWVFRNNPKSVIASGGADFYKTHEWFDNVMCIYEYDSPSGPTRAFYQVLTTTSNGGYFESFMGTDGTLQISEAVPKTKVLREQAVEPWTKWVNAGILMAPAPMAAPVAATPSNVVVDSRATPPPEEWKLPIEVNKPLHQCHLENFFDAIRFGTKLNCPPEAGYETAVAVLAVNRAIETNSKIVFKPEDFIVS